MTNVSFKDDLTYVLVNSDIRDMNLITFPLILTDGFKETSIDYLGLKARGSNVLKRHNIFTMEDILKNFGALMKFRNCGVDTVKEIKNKFLQFWYESINDEQRTEFWEEFITTNAA